MLFQTEAEKRRNAFETVLFLWAVNTVELFKLWCRVNVLYVLYNARTHTSTQHKENQFINTSIF